MAIATPTLREIQARIISDIESETGQTIPLLSKAVFRVLAFALAGAWIILYKYGTDAFKQRFVQTCNSTWLSILGELVDVYRQPATTWDGTANVTSTVSVGDLPAGTQLVNNNTGVVYIITTTATLSIGTVNFSLAATTGGALGNLSIGDTIDFVQPLAGVESTAEVYSVVTEGEDQEALETYRQRVLNKYQKKPQGGALADYEAWGLEAPNVISVYPYSTTPGEVDCYIEVDDQTDGIPTTSQLAVALSYIKFDPITGFATRRPVTAEVTTNAITRSTFAFEVVSLSPDTAETREDIENALIALMEAKFPYIQGLSITRNDTISQAQATSIVQTVASDAGATISGVKVRLLGSLIDLHVLGEGEKAKTTAGDISFT